ncbi:MAG: repeat protein [Chitinophagaceae bacterium]|nr:repeat protein [Chitinophagaceae bacterium]
MIKKLFTILLILITGLKISAQVNLQSGSATFSLPMFNWQDDKSRLNSVVALNYNSGNGLKVNDVASNVGQGWNLLAGGVITRIQAGEPDDQIARAGAVNDISKYPPGYLYNTVSPSNGAPFALTRYPIYKDKNHIYKQPNEVAADRELDHFAFQFNGRSGVFVLSKIYSDVLYNHSGTAVMLGDSKMKITFVTVDNMVYNTKGIRTTITSFNIQDENGLIYKFAEHDLTKVTKTSFCDKNLNKQTQPKFKNDHVYHEATFDDNDPSIVNPYIINGWYLTEIEDALTHRKINLNYETRTINSSAGSSITNYTSNNSGIFTPEKNYSIISHAKAVTVTPVISSIAYPDGHNVQFNYGSARVDLIGDKVLASVDITYQGRYLSKYQVQTKYFILNRYGWPITDYEKACARLCLRSVRKIGVDLKGDDPPYVFDYNLGSSTLSDIVPPPFFHLKDIWGFYNGDNSRNYDNNQSIPVQKSLGDLENNDCKGLCFYNGFNIMSAKQGFAKNGLLKRINYPTGGSLNYSYAQNNGVLMGQTTSTEVGGVHVSSTSVTDGGYSNDCNHPITTNYVYNLQGSTQSSLWGMEYPVNTLPSFNHFAPIDKYVKGSLWPPSVGCDFRYKYPGILSREQAVNISLSGQVLQFAMNLYSTISTIKTIINAISSADPITLIIQIVVDFAISCIGDHHVDNETHIYYNSDLNSANPLPGQFKRVEVIPGSGSEGKTVYDFTSNDDYPIWRPDNSETFSSEQRYAYWAYGLPKKITVCDVNGYPVKQTQNDYDPTFFQSQVGNPHYGSYNGFPNCKYRVIKSSSQKNTEWEDPETYNPYNSSGYPSGNFTTANISDMNVRLYPIYTGRLQVYRSYERSFKPNSLTENLETLKEYEYSQDNYQVSKVKVTQSNGDINFEEIKYSGDYYMDQTLMNNNILGMPLKITNGIIKNGTTYYTGESVTELADLSNGDRKPSRILEKRFSQPSLTVNVPQIEIQTFTYDASANLSGIKDEGNHVIKNIYGYNDKYVIGSVINADPVNDPVAYTSFEGSVQGGWLTIGAAQFNTSSSVTGSGSLLISASHSLWAPLNNSKAYRLSFWATSNLNVSNSALLKAGPTINVYTYYEYSIPSGTSTVTVSGNATIDELRLYPQSARMRTVTYDPLIGKTSECDENNRITYYEYDDHARLQFIKDEKKNVIKMYTYNIAKKPVCPVTYFNYAVSEVFIKNDCPAGYTGGAVTYTIPENTFTSTISQDVVDQQVQNQINSFGQSYANSVGSCVQLFYNAAISQTFQKEGCDIGYEGTSITYTVPYGKYSSTIPGEADEQAQNEMDANAQAFANLPGNASCVISYTPVWIGTGAEQCQNGHKLVQVIDQNPNSSSYNQTQWIDSGADASCPASTCDYNNCNGDDKRCVNNSCETGYKVYTDSYYVSENVWRCVYHYEWSDGYWSGDYYEYHNSNYQCYQIN